MSQSDVELVREIFARLGEDGVDAVAENLHPDFEFATPPQLASEPGTYRGLEGIRRWFDSFYEAMDMVRLQPDQIVDAGPGKVVVEFRILTRGRSTGLELSQEAAMLIRLVDGKAWRFEIVATKDEAQALAEVEA